MRKYLAILLITVLVLIFAGTAIAQQEASDELYVLIAPHIGIQHWQVHKVGFEAAAEELGVQTEFTGVMGDSIEDQVRIMEQIVAKNPAGILIGPLSPEPLTPSINRAMEAGIPVIAVDTDAENSNRLCYIGTNGYAAGQLAADVMAGLLNEEGKVGISNLLGFATCEERANGFRDRIAEKYPNMSVAAEVDDKADEEHATAVNTQMLVANDDIVGIFGVNAVSAIGMGAAVKSLDKVGEVKIVAFDPQPQTLQLIAEDVVHATMVQRNWAMSYYGLKFLYDYNHGRLELVKGWDVPAIQKMGVNTLPTRVDTGTMVVTKENYKMFEEK